MTFSHPWGAAAGNIIVRETFGIQPLEAAFGKIQIKPQIGTLDYATIKTPTIKGSMEVYVCKNPADALYEMTTTIPANTTATVYVPVSGSTGGTVVGPEPAGRNIRTLTPMKRQSVTFRGKNIDQPPLSQI